MASKPGGYHGARSHQKVAPVFFARAKNLPVPPREERGAFDSPCAPCNSDCVGTKGVPPFQPVASGAGRTKGIGIPFVLNEKGAALAHGPKLVSIRMQA